jgi:hypothetical protein
MTETVAARWSRPRRKRGHLSVSISESRKERKGALGGRCGLLSILLDCYLFCPVLLEMCDSISDAMAYHFVTHPPNQPIGLFIQFQDPTLPCMILSIILLCRKYTETSSRMTARIARIDLRNMASRYQNFRRVYLYYYALLACGPIEEMNTSGPYAIRPTVGQ